ncbi:hypothetical protein M885DRAFT_253513 [Pelagophyceae sp. CCMP2097]|nr:hypothetical protein M885DRAFT_253513 [Pelagophyceae sp. CCMP2097]
MVTKAEGQARKKRIEGLMFGAAEAAQAARYAAARPQLRPQKSDVTGAGILAAMRADNGGETAKAARRRASAERATSLPPKAELTARSDSVNARSDSVAALKRALAEDREALAQSTAKRGMAHPPADFMRSSSGGKQTAQSLNGTSVVLLGASRSGKTLVTQTFCGGVAQLRPAPTVGVERHDVASSSGDVRVWDTSGDARFDDAALGLVRGASAILVLYVFDDAASLDFAMGGKVRFRLQCAPLPRRRQRPGSSRRALRGRGRGGCSVSPFLDVSSVAFDRLRPHAALRGAPCRKREASERAFAEKRAQDAELAASSNDTAADLEVVCYFLALLFLLLGSV